MIQFEAKEKYCEIIEIDDDSFIHTIPSHESCS